jgi:hypothetical protein
MVIPEGRFSTDGPHGIMLGGGAARKFPEIFGINDLIHHEFAPPEQSLTGRDSGFCVTVSRRAMAVLSCHHPATALSGPRSEWLLALPCSGRRHNFMRASHISIFATQLALPKKARDPNRGFLPPPPILRFASSLTRIRL